jgi:two-component system chemotaxis sensor kinase CheA
VERIDKIMTLAEELVLGRNRLLQLNTQLVAAHGEEELVNRLNEATAQVNMLTGELQESVMMMRMIPVSRVFARFPRMVRDLARDLNKQIELVVEDHDAEIDKSVADEIGDPLIHLIRNAVDHGVETPELRQQAGKDPRGTIRLSATHEANHIVLRIQDDGKGMDPVKLKQKAVERGILSAADAERMEDTEAYNLIFLPGFSMAQAITSVSGRGVGMDVVRTNITRLNGTIDLESVLGQGTTITIRLPLTLAIISGLQVGAAGEIFIVPLTAVIEALRISQDQVENLQGRQVILARDKVLPLINLAQVLQVPAAKSEKNEAYVVVTGLAERRMGILVDRLLGQVDVVIKALGDFVGPAQGIAGATILGDGRVRLILDVGKLMDLQERYREVG